MNKYEELKEQVEFEKRCCIAAINSKYESSFGRMDPGMTFMDYMMNNEINKYLTAYEKGMLFSYMSIISKIEQLEEAH